MLLISVLYHVFFDDFAIQSTSFLHRHSSQALPCRVLVLADEVKKPRFGHIDVSDCALLEILIDFQAFVRLEQYDARSF